MVININIPCVTYTIQELIFVTTRILRRESFTSNCDRNIAWPTTQHPVQNRAKFDFLQGVRHGETLVTVVEILIRNLF